MAEVMRLAYPELHQPRQSVLHYYVPLAVLSEVSTPLRARACLNKVSFGWNLTVRPVRRDALGSQRACSIETNITLRELIALS